MLKKSLYYKQNTTKITKINTFNNKGDISQIKPLKQKGGGISQP